MDSSPPGHPETVATTWSLAFQHVEQANPAAADLLRLCAFLAPDVIPEDILTQGASALGKVLKSVASDPMQLNEAIQELRRYSLLKRNRETRTLSIHRLVQVTLQDMMPPKVQQQWAERAVRALIESFPSVDMGTWRQAQPYLPHAEVCQSLIEHYTLAFPGAASLLHRYGLYFYYAGKYKQAESLLQRALHIRERARGPEHSDTATTLHSLAALYQNQGKYEQAEPLYQRALRISEQSLGPEHPHTATTLYELARLYKNQGRYKEAEPLYQRALRISEQALGPEHPYTAVTLYGLASLHQKQGKYKEADPLYQRALTIDEQAFGVDHPEVATDLEGYADLLSLMKRPNEAEALRARAKQIRDKHSS